MKFLRRNSNLNGDQAHASRDLVLYLNRQSMIYFPSPRSQTQFVLKEPPSSQDIYSRELIKKMCDICLPCYKVCLSLLLRSKLIIRLLCNF